jgi:hypothetical protein
MDVAIEEAGDDGCSRAVDDDIAVESDPHIDDSVSVDDDVDL